VPQSVYELPVASMHHIANRQLTPGQTWRLPDGSTVTFAGVSQWATFQVAHDPGKTVVLVAGVCVVAGLLGSLRVRRRRFWLRAAPVTGPGADGRSVVVAAGLPRTDPDGFRQEFESTVRRIKDQCNG
jgi:cytochrome c biogenesis protein